MRFGLALALGILAALLVVQFPASAADQSIAAQNPYGWDRQNVTIDVNDSVTWTNPFSGMHNVCVHRTTESGCGEYRSDDPRTDWPSGGYPHKFTSDGTFTFLCQQHPNVMTGTIKVGTGENPPTGTGTGTGTGTSTTPPPDTQPTDTTTVPAQTQTTATDTAAPSFTGKVKRRSSRTALTLSVGSSEDATLRATVLRRAPSRRSFTRISQSALHVKQGKNVVTLLRKLGKARRGAYRVKLQLVDAAGNASATKTLSFKIA